MKTLLLVSGLWVMAPMAWGQVYAAPGMPVKVSGPVAAPVPARGVRASPVKKTTSAPAVPPIKSPVFPRCWHEAEPARSQLRKQYYQFQQQSIRYPATSLRAGIGGSIWALLAVRADGTVETVRVTRRVIDDEVESIDAPSPAAEAALDAEVVRVTSQIRFAPAAIAPDTVTVVQRFIMQ